MYTLSMYTLSMYNFIYAEAVQLGGMFPSRRFCPAEGVGGVSRLLVDGVAGAVIPSIIFRPVKATFTHCFNFKIKTKVVYKCIYSQKQTLSLHKIVTSIGYVF